MAKGKENMMNRAEESIHKGSSVVREKPAASRGESEVGNERKAEVNRVQIGGSRAEAWGSVLSDPDREPKGLKGAVAELHKQHPHHHSAGGVHGTSDHIRHEHLGGLRPSKG